VSNGLSKDPANIAELAIDYLETIEVSEKTKRIYEDVLANRSVLGINRSLYDLQPEPKLSKEVKEHG